MARVDTLQLSSNDAFAPLQFTLETIVRTQAGERLKSHLMDETTDVVGEKLRAGIEGCEIWTRTRVLSRANRRGPCL